MKEKSILYWFYAGISFEKYDDVLQEIYGHRVDKSEKMIKIEPIIGIDTI
ncbi:MAG: hypothetical protein PHP52_02105 [Bacteroidales bacterium]|nr:hypothetical protein [Bacteroidales bacterium]MDD4215844.1 hypothetical protein [Bacteroidales bacterium]MDY0140703.1 hypothetical protein [Bacteroidales bacterium]